MQYKNTSFFQNLPKASIQTNLDRNTAIWHLVTDIMMTYEFCLNFCIILKNFATNFQFKLIRDLIGNWFRGTNFTAFYCVKVNQLKTKTIFRKSRILDIFKTNQKSMQKWINTQWSFSRYVVFFHKILWYFTVLVPDANEDIRFEKNRLRVSGWCISRRINRRKPINNKTKKMCKLVSLSNKGIISVYFH